MTSKLRVCRSIHDLDADEWDACFPGDMELASYYSAVEDAGLPGFSFFYLALVESDEEARSKNVGSTSSSAAAERDEMTSRGKLLAVVPGFFTDYHLDTGVEGALKGIAAKFARIFPTLFTIALASLGSPVAERCHLGFAPHVPQEEHAGMFARLLEGFTALAAECKVGLLAVKDAGIDPVWRVGRDFGFLPMPSLPTALLDVPASMEVYLARLSTATRKDMRRKRKNESAVRMEERTNLEGILPDVMRLYAATRDRSDLQFEELTPEFFINTLARVPGALCVCYYVGEELAAFNLLIQGPHVLVDKFVGTSGTLGKKYSLYFLSWFRNVQRCIDAGIPLYWSGQAAYEPKLRLGCRLVPNAIYFRHRNPLLNATLRLVSRFVKFDN